MQRGRAVHQPRAGERRAVALERLAGGGLHARVAGQAEVVVGAEHQPLAPLHRHDRPGLGLHLPEVRDQVLAARVVDQLAPLVVASFLEQRPGVVAGSAICARLPRVSVEVKPVSSRRDLTRFIKLPMRLYRNEPNWIPPLVAERRAFLDRRKNPVLPPRRRGAVPGLARRAAGGPDQRPRRPPPERLPAERLGAVRVLRVRERPRGGRRAARHGPGVAPERGPGPHGRPDGLHHQRRVRPDGGGPRARPR